MGKWVGRLRRRPLRRARRSAFGPHTGPFADRDAGLETPPTFGPHTGPNADRVAGRATAARPRAAPSLPYLSEAVNATPEIVAAHIVSGSADFLLEVAVADLAHYERVMFETLLKLPNVADVRSNFALRTVKAPGPLPI